MKIEKLKEDLATYEKKLKKIQKGISEKPEIEKKIANLKKEIETLEKEQSEFFSEITKSGLTLDEVKAKLGIGGI
jgi:predicted RNase H-like nuclease (RuvC/YqgF family)